MYLMYHLPDSYLSVQVYKSLTRLKVTAHYYMYFSNDCSYFLVDVAVCNHGNHNDGKDIDFIFKDKWGKAHTVSDCF